MVNVWAAICCSLQRSAKCQICPPMQNHKTRQPRNGGDVNLHMQVPSAYIIHHMNWSSLTWPKHKTTSTDNLAVPAGVVLFIKVVSLTLGEPCASSPTWKSVDIKTSAAVLLSPLDIFCPTSSSPGACSSSELQHLCIARSHLPYLPRHTWHHPMSFHRMSYCFQEIPQRLGWNLKFL